MKRHLGAAITILTLAVAGVALAADTPTVVRLYPGPAPGSEEWTQTETTGTLPQLGGAWVANVVEPTLTVFLPPAGTANGAGVIVCPGGGFHILSFDNEGTAVASWLNQQGIAAFVLKYRLVATGENPMAELMAKMREPGKLAADAGPVVKMAVADGLRAVELVRGAAAEYGLKPERIGIMGFSAGGTVTLGVALDGTGPSRPDFIAPIYGAAGFLGDFTVPEDAPPAFVVGASDDQLGLAPDSVSIYSKWIAAKRPAELHMYAKGGHGFGMREQNIPTDHWIDRFGDWLGAQGLLAQ